MDNIFEGMSQQVHDSMCCDKEYREIFEAESERIGQERIEKAFKTAEWMSPDEFGDYIKGELKKIYKVD